MSKAYKAAAAAVLALRRGTPKSAATQGQLQAAQDLEDALDSIADAERGLNEWREMALSQAGDAGLLARAMKAETEAGFLRGEVDRLTEELDSANLARMVADVVKRDAYRYRKLLMSDKHWLGVFYCNPDGTPSDSISNDELSARLDAMDGPELMF